MMGVFILLNTIRTRAGETAILEELGVEGKHTPDEYPMRLHLTFKSGDKRYSWLDSIVAIANSARNGTKVIYDAYQVL